MIAPYRTAAVHCPFIVLQLVDGLRSTASLLLFGEKALLLMMADGLFTATDQLFVLIVIQLSLDKMDLLLFLHPFLSFLLGPNILLGCLCHPAAPSASRWMMPIRIFKDTSSKGAIPMGWRQAKCVICLHRHSFQLMKFQQLLTNQSFICLKQPVKLLHGVKIIMYMIG